MTHGKTDSQLPALERVVTSALQHLEELGYSARTRGDYERAWGSLVRFANKNAPRCTRVRDLEADFLASCGIAPGQQRDLTCAQDMIRRGLRILIEFQETGRFRPHKKRIEEPCLPPLLRQELERYEAFCKHHLRHEVECMRSFLRFLCTRGLVGADLVAQARALRFSKEHHLPPVWPPETVEALLEAVDRSSSLGKRDYAILLLAARLGLRACDIRALALDNIQWAEARLTLTQTKNGRYLSLPLSEELGQALIDYLRHARPRSPHRAVFLKARAPYEPFGPTNPLHSVITATLRRASISLPRGMPRGLHSLRHTLARVCRL